MSSQADAYGLMLDAVATFEKLEVVYALHRSDRARTVADLAGELGMGIEPIEEAVAGLERDRVIAKDGTAWRLDREGPRARAVDALVAAYEHDRVGVLRRLTQIALERIRADAARTFADAFVLRPKKGDGDG